MNDKLIIKLETKDQFHQKLKDTPRDLIGRVVIFDDSTDEMMIVGNKEFHPLNRDRFGHFLKDLMEMEASRSRLRSTNDRTMDQLETVQNELGKVTEALQSVQAGELPKKVERTLKYMATRFAVRIQSANSTKQSLSAIDHAVKQMIEFVQNFNKLELRDYFVEGDFHPEVEVNGRDKPD